MHMENAISIMPGNQQFLMHIDFADRHSQNLEKTGWWALSVEEKNGAAGSSIIATE